MKPDGTPYTLDDVKAMTDAVIGTPVVADVTRISPARINMYALTGQLPWATIRSGNRIKHVRADFIRFLTGGKKDGVQDNQDHDRAQVQGEDV